MVSEVINEDCREVMRRFEDEFFDITITSPPYNLGSTHHTGNKKFNPYKDDLLEEDYQEQQMEVLNDIFRITKGDGSLFYNHKNRIKNGFQISPYDWISKTKWMVKQEVVWFNGSQNFDKCRFYPMTERIYWLSKQKDTRFTNNINHHDFFEWSAVGTEDIHKRAYPLDLVIDILKCFPEGLNVFDPYSGSGTTRIAARKLNFNFWGCEINEDYFKEGCNRFEREIEKVYTRKNGTKIKQNQLFGL